MILHPAIFVWTVQGILDVIALCIVLLFMAFIGVLVLIEKFMDWRQRRRDGKKG